MARRGLLAVVIIGIALGTLMRPPIPQDPGYHQMADQRALLGIPNCLNVLSNLPFALVGCFGLAATFRRRPPGSPFPDPWLRWPYAALFTGSLLTAFGSSYYHLAPDNGRLVWDRLPMTLAFMGLLSAVIGERASAAVARVVFGPLLLLGAASIGYWYWSELRGLGDLRPYVLVQFGSLLVIALLLILYPARGRDAWYLMAGLAAYAAAKALELSDQRVFARMHVVSGHTLKHLMAGAAVGCLAMMIHRRQDGHGGGPARVGRMAPAGGVQPPSLR